MDLQLTGKKAIVTGASRGIGRAIARQLALEGCDVAICARTAGPLQEAAAALAHESGRQVVPIVCDTLNADAIKAIYPGQTITEATLERYAEQAQRDGTTAEEILKAADARTVLKHIVTATDERVSDHGHAIGISIRDPDGNGIEVSYERPSSEWGHDPTRDMIGGTQRGRLPGPWDEDLARDARARPEPSRSSG
jgi:short chain dehydrogenase